MSEGRFFGNLFISLRATLGTLGYASIMSRIVHRVPEEDWWAFARSCKFLFECMSTAGTLGRWKRLGQTKNQCLFSLSRLTFLHKERLLIPFTQMDCMGMVLRSRGPPIVYAKWFISKHIASPHNVGNWALENDYLDVIKWGLERGWISEQGLYEAQSRRALDMIMAKANLNDLKDFDFGIFLLDWPEYRLKWLLEHQHIGHLFIDDHLTLQESLEEMTPLNLNPYVIMSFISCFFEPFGSPRVTITNCTRISDSICRLIPVCACQCGDENRHKGDKRRKV